MTKFIYNNVKNARIEYIFFNLNYKYHTYISYKNNINLYSKPKLVNK